MSEERAPYIVEREVGTLNEFKNRACCLKFEDNAYTAPSPEDIKALRDMMDWSQSDLAKMTGVTYSEKKGSTTIRRWMAPLDSNEHRDIPYSAWRLLLMYAGIASPNEYTRKYTVFVHGKGEDFGPLFKYATNKSMLESWVLKKHCGYDFEIMKGFFNNMRHTDRGATIDKMIVEALNNPSAHTIS